MTKKTGLQPNKEEAVNKEEALEYLVWSILLNLSKFKSISFARLYKTLNLTSSEIWVGPRICWICAQSPEFGKLVQKKGRGSYQISPHGEELLDILSRRYGNQFTVENAYKLYEISRKISVKELKEYVKSISKEA